MCFAIYAIYTYTSEDHTNRVAALKDLKSTYTYYDKNRKLAGIQRLTWLAKEANFKPKTCPDTYVKEDIYTWPGSVEGYKNTVDSKYYVGKSPDYNEEPKHKAIVTDFWKGGSFCVKRIQTEDLKARVAKD